MGMCMCVECVEDLPEPVEVEENGKFAIFYKSDRLTQWYGTKDEAWDEFGEKYRSNSTISKAVN